MLGGAVPCRGRPPRHLECVSGGWRRCQAASHQRVMQIPGACTIGDCCAWGGPCPAVVGSAHLAQASGKLGAPASPEHLVINFQCKSPCEPGLGQPQPLPCKGQVLRSPDPGDVIGPVLHATTLSGDRDGGSLFSLEGTDSTLRRSCFVCRARSPAAGQMLLPLVLRAGPAPGAAAHGCSRCRVQTRSRGRGGGGGDGGAAPMQGAKEGSEARACSRQPSPPLRDGAFWLLVVGPDGSHMEDFLS